MRIRQVGIYWLNVLIITLRKISPQVKAELEKEPQVCARAVWCGEYDKCRGRITWEHTLIYAGKQIDEVWSIIKLCEYHHDVNTQQGNGDLNKEKNVWIALNRASDQELEKYSKAINYKRERERLNKKYDEYRTQAN